MFFSSILRFSAETGSHSLWYFRLIFIGPRWLWWRRRWIDLNTLRSIRVSESDSEVSSSLDSLCSFLRNRTRNVLFCSRSLEKSENPQCHSIADNNTTQDHMGACGGWMSYNDKMSPEIILLSVLLFLCSSFITKRRMNDLEERKYNCHFVSSG